MTRSTTSRVLLGLAAIDAAIVRIASTGQEFQTLVHETGIQVLLHVEKHRDTGVAERLVVAMPKGARPKALAFWIGLYSPIRITMDALGNITKVRLLKKGDKDFRPFDIDKADANPFWVVPEKDPAPFTYERMLASLRAVVKGYDKNKDDLKGAGKTAAGRLVKDLSKLLDTAPIANQNTKARQAA